MKLDIAQLKQQLPLDALLHRLGHGELARQKAHCPFHDDNRTSFSVWPGPTSELRWKCFAGCGQGDVIDFVQKFFNLPDAKSAIRQYSELADMSIIVEATRRFNGKVAKSQPPAKLEPLTRKAAEQIGKWRGLSPEFLMEMSDKGIIGLYENKPAFATEGGVQYRIPGDGWRFSPGAKNSLLLLPSRGDSLDEPYNVFVVESNWDALALRESTSKGMILCTRGAANARLATNYISTLPPTVIIVAIPHNDKPGEDWLAILRAWLTAHEFKVKRVPKPFKDFNDFYKANKIKLTI